MTRYGSEDLVQNMNIFSSHDEIFETTVLIPEN